MELIDTVHMLSVLLLVLARFETRPGDAAVDQVIPLETFEESRELLECPPISFPLLMRL